MADWPSFWSCRIPVVTPGPCVVLVPGRAGTFQGRANSLVVEVVDVSPIVAPGPVGCVVRIVKDVALGTVESDEVELDKRERQCV